MALIMNNKQLFILSMRRSGSSITRELLLKHPKIGNIEFEPYLLWMACRLQEIPRYRRNVYLSQLLTTFKEQNRNKWNGAKWVINPGIEGMYWQVLPKLFPEAKFIFIIRNPVDTYKSWVIQDENSTRGIVNYNMYEPWYHHIIQSFEDFHLQQPEKSVILNYEGYLEDVDSELNKVWKLLQIEELKGFQKFIKGE